MPRKVFKRFLPDPAKIKENRWIALLGDKIHNSELWHLTKHSVAGAFFIGIFCAFLPIPFQSLLAAFLAILFKRNLALSAALVFITNPITMPPIFYFNYWVGNLFLNSPVIYEQLVVHDNWSRLLANFDTIGKPLILGSIICGLVFGYLSYLSIQFFWIWKVKNRWRERKKHRKNRNAHDKLNS
ncbi:MAG: DUF2062 domain-containing protein [Pseudomonadales bacterium]|nr:DUF2062 domain-containing protein [Pseudomonadales bacterium]